MKLYIIFCLFGLSLSQGCVEQLQQSVEENIDFPGSDVLQILSPDVNHCQLACTQHALCQFFTFVRPTWTADKRQYFCYLKNTPSGEPDIKKPLNHVTSGFSLKGCVTKPSFCLSKVFTDVDFFGEDYRSLFTPDPVECQRACTNDLGCQFFTFLTETFPNESIRFKCHLKYKKVPLPPVIKAQEGVISGFSQKLLPARGGDTTGCQTKIFPSTNIVGGDIEQSPAVSAEHCLFLCSTHPTCTYFSYTTAKYKTSNPNEQMRCFLKKNSEEMRTVAAEEVHSGMPARFCQTSDAWVKAEYQGLDFVGEDSRHFFLASSKACQQSCTEDPYCQYYTYATDTFHLELYRSNCFLKQSINIPLPPKMVTTPNLVSGFSLKNC
ncbi:coagulation factor XI [Esox lucius]|uniref:Apple domain-containing protein n=1 Tax=Esox lucius TaxID=8010 RepID=A0A3P8YIZ1_ESOLU|nr:coagulation factor XI [Esox lucius]